MEELTKKQLEEKTKLTIGYIKRPPRKTEIECWCGSTFYADIEDIRSGKVKGCGCHLSVLGLLED